MRRTAARTPRRGPRTSHPTAPSYAQPLRRATACRQLSFCTPRQPANVPFDWVGSRFSAECFAGGWLAALRFAARCGVAPLGTGQIIASYTYGALTDWIPWLEPRLYRLLVATRSIRSSTPVAPGLERRTRTTLTPALLYMPDYPFGALALTRAFYWGCVRGLRGFCRHVLPRWRARQQRAFARRVYAELGAFAYRWSRCVTPPDPGMVTWCIARFVPPEQGALFGMALVREVARVLREGWGRVPRAADGTRPTIGDLAEATYPVCTVRSLARAGLLSGAARAACVEITREWGVGLLP